MLFSLLPFFIKAKIFGFPLVSKNMYKCRSFVKAKWCNENFHKAGIPVFGKNDKNKIQIVQSLLTKKKVALPSLTHSSRLQITSLTYFCDLSPVIKIDSANKFKFKKHGCTKSY